MGSPVSAAISVSEWELPDRKVSRMAVSRLATVRGGSAKCCGNGLFLRTPDRHRRTYSFSAAARRFCAARARPSRRVKLAVPQSILAAMAWKDLGGAGKDPAPNAAKAGGPAATHRHPGPPGHPGDQKPIAVGGL